MKERKGLLRKGVRLLEILETGGAKPGLLLQGIRSGSGVRCGCLAFPVYTYLVLSFTPSAGLLGWLVMHACSPLVHSS